jgi:alpha-tubulin suppressor-like RCC1 family protein
MALGSDFAIGVKEDGTVWSWGGMERSIRNRLSKS